MIQEDWRNRRHSFFNPSPRLIHASLVARRRNTLHLAVQTTHKAVVLDDAGHFCTPILTVHTRPGDLDQLLARARDGAPSAEVQLVMEPTGMAWFPIAVYYARQALPIYLVNSQEVADLRRYYARHVKSDRIDARVLAGSHWSIPTSSTVGAARRRSRRCFVLGKAAGSSLAKSASPTTSDLSG